MKIFNKIEKFAPKRLCHMEENFDMCNFNVACAYNFSYM